MIRVYFKKLGGHIHCRVFGPQPGKSGDLTFREEEWERASADLRSGNVTLSSEDVQRLDDLPVCSTCRSVPCLCRKDSHASSA
jgi:hypothetical protein